MDAHETLAGLFTAGPHPRQQANARRPEYPRAMAESVEVVIVGAGLAGLTCALALQAEGVDVRVLEAGDGVGGRVRTDEVHGFLLDRGFQLLNPSYRMVGSLVDLDALDLQTFTAGLAVRSSRHSELLVLADPVREPQLIAQTLRSGKLHPASLGALARWVAPAANPDALIRGDKEDQPRRESMDDIGLLGPLRRLIDTFLAGMTLEDDGSTSTAFTRLLVRSLMKGTPGVPAQGMQALPEQLAARLARPVELNTRVVQVSPGPRPSVHTQAGEQVEAELVVVATDPGSYGELTGQEPRPGKGVTTHWFATDQAPTDLSLLVIDQSRESGPVLNTAVLSNVAPNYAPAGQHLVQTSSLLPSSGTPPTDEEVLAHAAKIYGAKVETWSLLRRDDIGYALPAQPAPFIARHSMMVADGVIAAGDHRDTASIQGAMTSGRRAAEGFLQRRSGEVADPTGE